MTENNETTELELEQAAPEAAACEEAAEPKKKGRARTFFGYLGWSILFCAILLGLLIGIGAILSPKSNSAESGMLEARGHGFLAEPDNTLDVVYLGNSIVSTAVSPMVIWENTGITSYVSAANGQQTDYAYSVLKEIFDKQSPKVVVFEVDMLYSNFEIPRALKQVGKDYFSIIEYHHRWKSLTPEDFRVGSVVYDEVNDLKGYNPKTLVVPAEGFDTYMDPTDEAEGPEAINRWLIGVIKGLCDENGAKLVLVSTPHVLGWNMERHNGTVQLAAELGVEFYDMNFGEDKVAIDWNEDTRDAGSHLNYKGADKTSIVLGAYLASHFGLEGHFDDVAIASAWSESLVRYKATMEDVQAHPENYDTVGVEVG